MGSGERTLSVSFESVEALRQEYQSNLINGGIFVATEECCGPREVVRVRIELAFASEVFLLPGEVVHVIPAEMTGAGGTPGVAVQLQENAMALRDRLLPYLEGDPDPDPEPDSRRRTQRKRARVSARIDGEGGAVTGRTQDLSQGGALVGVEGDVPVGERVQLTLRHPTTSREMGVPGRVVRQIESEGAVSAVAIEFAPPEEDRAEVERFVEDIQRVEHARRLGGIVGPIQELGPQNLVQMFATAAPEGTLFLRNDQEEGLVGFQGGLLRYSRLGSVTGMKALVRMLTWRDGSFEFHARLEEMDGREPPLPLEAALLDAMRQIDEASLVDDTRFPLHARLTVGGSPAEGHDLSKLEAAVLDLARAGFTVARILAVIPEPDPEIFRALAVLADCGVLVLVEG